MSVYSIYKVTNKLNNKKYIGFTCNPRVRFYQHTKAETDTAIHRAIRLYGCSNFKFEIIYQSKDFDYTLKIMEPYFIEEYDTYKSGYNSSKGGSGKPPKQKPMSLEEFTERYLPNFYEIFDKPYSDFMPELTP